MNNIFLRHNMKVLTFIGGLTIKYLPAVGLQYIVMLNFTEVRINITQKIIERDRSASNFNLFN